jgi:hypothetical protein
MFRWSTAPGRIPGEDLARSSAQLPSPVPQQPIEGDHWRRRGEGPAGVQRRQPQSQAVRGEAGRAIAVGFGAILPGPINEAVDKLRRDLDETLEATTISDATVDHWHAVADS